jgi:hypothetical protein
MIRRHRRAEAAGLIPDGSGRCCQSTNCRSDFAKSRLCAFREREGNRGGRFCAKSGHQIPPRNLTLGVLRWIELRLAHDEAHQIRGGRRDRRPPVSGRGLRLDRPRSAARPQDGRRDRRRAAHPRRYRGLACSQASSFRSVRNTWPLRANSSITASSGKTTPLYGCGPDEIA